MVRQLGLTQLVQPTVDSLRADTTVVVSLRTARPMPEAEQQRQWLSRRAGGKRAVQLLVEAQPK